MCHATELARASSVASQRHDTAGGREALHADRLEVHVAGRAPSWLCDKGECTHEDESNLNMLDSEQ